MKMRTGRYSIATILLLLLLPVLNSSTHAQSVENFKVSVRASNKPLHNVLDDLTSQCGFYFTFDSRLIDSRKRITMNLKDVTIKQAIDTLFQKSGLSFRIINNNIVIYPETAIVRKIAADTSSTPSKTLEVRGMIRDQRTEKPLPFATVGLMDTYFGTISNEDGSFVLRIPDTLANPILVTSFIGYKNQYIPISLDSNEPVDILLTKNIISLQEVIIRYQDPVELLSESIQKIRSNYLDEPAGMTAYYRERVSRDDKCMVFSEAVVEIAKAPYTKSFMSERSRLLKGRKITNIELEDTVVFKIRSGLNTLLKLDIINHPPGFLTNDFKLAYNLHFSDVVSFKDQLVYVISFQQKENIDETLFRGDLYIDRENLAILAADFEYDPVRLGREAEMFVAKKSRRVKIRPVSAKYHVEYSDSDQGYHLAMVQGDVKFKVRKKREWIASKYSVSLEMAITAMDPGNPPEIKLGEQIKASSIMSEENFAYDPGFWGDYNTIAPEADLTEALTKIEKTILEISERPQMGVTADE